MSTPRLPPLTDAELSDEQAELLAPLGATGEMNIFRTLVRHPRLYKRWSGFAGLLLRQSSLEPRDRELVILRAALRSTAAYEWAHHVPIGREAGLSEAEILAAGGHGEPGSADDATLLRAVDQLFDDYRIDDETWAALSARLTEEQMMELPMLAGHYRLLAGALNSFGTEVEPGYPALGEVTV
jgi:4-carboxymuconolactone decarboxylase